MLDDILQTIILLMQPLTPLVIRQAALPVGEGVCLQAGAASTVTTHLDRATVQEVSCVLNCRSAELRTARDTLTTLHHHLTRLPAYPNNERWQIASIVTSGGPTTIGREPNGMWTVGSSIRVTYYDKERVTNV